MDSSDTPTECLGIKFATNADRRRHFSDLLATKLRNPEFRKLDGFPSGSDEDILALSDPPYYTACPNPWIPEFVKRYGTPYNPASPYHRKPFAADVSEGKNHPIYVAHPYHTKVPHRAIMRYVLHFTAPGDFVFDGFAGTGMTGVACQLCGDRKEVEALGYRVGVDGTIFNEDGVAFSKLGVRKVLLNDLSPAATFIAHNYLAPIDQDVLEQEVQRIAAELRHEFGWMYETADPRTGTRGEINYVIWSDVNICTECAKDFIFWDVALDKKAGAIADTITCPHCKAHQPKRGLLRKVETIFDARLGKPISQAKQVPVLIDYSIERKRFQKIPDKDDIALINNISNSPAAMGVPAYELPAGNNTLQPKASHGLSHTHHFYTERTLKILTAYLSEASTSPVRDTLYFIFTSAHQYTNRLCRLHVGNFFNRKGGTVDKPLNATLYMPSLSVETNAISRLVLRSRVREALIAKTNDSLISTQSSSKLPTIPSSSIDYIFVDPPFGANIMYSEVNSLWESWLGILTNNTHEAVHNEAQNKDFQHYGRLMRDCFAECFRVLKPGRWMTIEFSNTKASVWNLIQSTLQESGFIVGNVSAIDKQKGSFKAMTTPTAVKQDLVISAYKPNGGLEERFSKTGHTKNGVWDFVRTHLKNLPTVKAKAGQLEFIVERDPRIIFDRMIAFYVSHTTPVPLSSAEFQSALTEQFSVRDGMIFLPEQVAEYDKKRAVMETMDLGELFVCDERTAIAWLRRFLTDRPSVLSDINPDFMQQLSIGWKKWETRPELKTLLEQNFLQYHGEEEVPSQIHAYLSTQYKDLRKLQKFNDLLRAKGKDRWFVPDPKKAIDVEALRDKRLLEEFWSFLPPGHKLQSEAGAQALPGLEAGQAKGPKKKLKEVRTEAIRVGFKHCFQTKDYQTILAVARQLPEGIIEEDEQLQMIYDMAEMRADGA